MAFKTAKKVTLSEFYEIQRDRLKNLHLDSTKSSGTSEEEKRAQAERFADKALDEIASELRKRADYAVPKSRKPPKPNQKSLRMFEEEVTKFIAREEEKRLQNEREERLRLSLPYR